MYLRSILLLILTLPLISLARVQVAFLEMKDAQGKIIELEKGSRFAHVAISYQGQWLQAYPYHGVEIVTTEQLQALGHVAAVIDIETAPEPSEAFVNSILGHAYDWNFSWDSNKYYCSKLVGKILGLKPEPMDFNAPYWPEYFRKYNGLPGLSPQGVYRQLTQNLD